MSPTDPPPAAPAAPAAAGLHPVAVLAGGLGTRMAGVAGDHLPKALLPVAGRPFLDHQLAGLAAAGARRVVLLIGHGAEAIASHVGNGERFGLDVACVGDGPRLLGTAGALRAALPHLGPRFWVTYGDTYLRAPMARAQAWFDGHADQESWQGMMTVLRNRDRWDRSNVAIGSDLVLSYRKGAPPGTFEYIDYGLSLLTAAALEDAGLGPGPADLQVVFQALIARRALGAFEVGDRFYEIGSPRGYAETEAFLREGLGLPNHS